MEISARLRDRFPRLSCEESFDFSRHTTIGCGGIASVAVSPSDTEETTALLGWLEREHIPFCFLGVGANVLPADGFYEGVVIRFWRLNALRAEGMSVIAGAGVTGGQLLRFAEKRGIGGFSPFSGIPMSLGGGTAMNAGVRELHFSDIVHSVLCAEKGKLFTFSKSDCAFSEKKSIFQQGIAVLGVRLDGRMASSADIARESCYFRTRRKNLPKGRSMGCTFVNPSGISAGALIEQCGLKGLRVGGALVSSEHANFILNENATAEDISRLIAQIKTKVKEKTGIDLREEIRRIP